MIAPRPPTHRHRGATATATGAAGVRARAASTAPRIAALVLVALAVLGAPATASAQLDDGARLLAEADFERAERAYTRVLAERELSREDLVLAYEGRAFARWAQGDAGGARQDLLALASLDPERTLPPEAPPPLVDAFAALPHAALGLDLEWEDDDGLAHLRVIVRNDAADLVRAVRVHARRRGEAWTVGEERAVTIRLERDQVAEVWVEAVGPGGAIVARRGSALAPLEHGDVAGVRGTLADPGAGPDPTPIWVGVGVGAGVLVAIAIIVGVAVGTAGNDATQPSAPVVVGF